MQFQRSTSWPIPGQRGLQLTGIAALLSAALLSAGCGQSSAPAVESASMSSGGDKHVRLPSVTRNSSLIKTAQVPVRSPDGKGPAHSPPEKTAAIMPAPAKSAQPAAATFPAKPVAA